MIITRSSDGLKSTTRRERTEAVAAIAVFVDDAWDLPIC